MRSGGVDLPDTPYEFWVNKTAKLLGRPYMRIHKIFEREGWYLDKIHRRYIECTKHCPDLTEPNIRWWALRKKEIETQKRHSEGSGKLTY